MNTADVSRGWKLLQLCKGSFHPRVRVCALFINVFCKRFTVQTGKDLTGIFDIRALNDLVDGRSMFSTTKCAETLALGCKIQIVCFKWRCFVTEAHSAEVVSGLRLAKLTVGMPWWMWIMSLFRNIMWIWLHVNCLPLRLVVLMKATKQHGEQATAHLTP